MLWKDSLVLLYLSLIVCCYGFSVPNSGLHQKQFSSNPIAIKMKCFQEPADTVFCQFDYTNTAQENYYLLEYNTPLEGLLSPFLTIRQGKHLINYEGILIRRLPATKSEYVLIPAGSTISSPAIQISQVYKFPMDGQYTVEYTGRLVLMPESIMAKLQDEKLAVSGGKLQQGSGRVLASTQLIVKDASNLEMLEKEKEAERVQQLMKDAETEIEGECLTPQYVGGTIEQKEQTTEIHRSLCKKYPKVIDAVTEESDRLRLWFGMGCNTVNIVKNVFSQSLEGLLQYTITYSFGGPHCIPKALAYTFYRSRTVYLCPAYQNVRSYCSPLQYSKEDTLVHEWTHAFSSITDIVYGVVDCQQLARNYPYQAIVNADNYAFFYCDNM